MRITEKQEEYPQGYSSFVLVSVCHNPPNDRHQQ